MDDLKTNLESLLYGYYIRYDKLNELCSIQFQNINRLDIYIDIFDMLKPIYTKPVYTNKQFVIVSSIINLAAHLRGYFWSRHRIATRIFLIYADDSSMNHKQFVPGFGDNKFRESYEFDKNNSVINSQLEMVKLLTGYIQGVYLIKRITNFAIFTYDNIIKNQEQALIITKSKYAYQIPAFTNSVIFRPKKYNGEDISYYIDCRNVLSALYDKNKSIINISSISPRLISLMMVLTGLRKYNLNMICNFRTASNMLIQAVSENKILNDYNSDPEYLYTCMPRISAYINLHEFCNRFNAIDLITQHRIYCQMAESMDNSWIIDLYDPEAVRNINNNYFIDNPLDLNNL